MKRILPRVIDPPEVLRRMGGASRDALEPEFSLLVWNVYKGRRAGWLRDLRRRRYDVVYDAWVAWR